MKQTAVDWFVKQLQGNSDIRWRGTKINELAEQANAMFEEQIKDAWVCGNNNFDEHGIGSDRYAISDESFYNETYKQNE